MGFLEHLQKFADDDEGEMTPQQSYELIRELLFSDKDSEPGKRKMLCISNIDPALVEVLRKRAEARGLSMYKYCTDLLLLAIKIEDRFSKRRLKSR